MKRLPLILVLSAVALAGPSRAAPLLSEVLYDAAGSDDGLVFVEIYAAPGSSLDGLWLEGINGSGGTSTVLLALSGLVPGDGFFVIADDRGDGSSDVPGADLVLDFDLQNGPDSLLLRDDDTVIDALGYGEFGAGDVFAGEGAPAPDAPAGSSLARHFADADSDDNAADWGVVAAPTPGSGPLSPVPEPASAGLVALGLLLLASRRRRRGRI